MTQLPVVLTLECYYVVWVELHHQLINPRSKGADSVLNKVQVQVLKAAVSSACIYDIIIPLVKCVDPKACA